MHLKLEPTKLKLLTGLHTNGWLLALSTNIREGGMWLTDKPWYGIDYSCKKCCVTASCCRFEINLIKTVFIDTWTSSHRWQIVWKSCGKKWRCKFSSNVTSSTSLLINNWSPSQGALVCLSGAQAYYSQRRRYHIHNTSFSS